MGVEPMKNPFDQFDESGFRGGDSELRNEATPVPIDTPHPAVQQNPFDQFQGSRPDVGQAPTGNAVDGGEYDNSTQPATRLSPELESQWRSLVTGKATVGQLVDFAAQHGFSIDPERAKAVVDARDSGKAYDPDPIYELPKVQTDAVGAFGRGAANGILLGGLPTLDAGIQGAKAALTGGDFGDTYNRQLDYDNAVYKSDENDHLPASLVGNLAGGALLPVGLEQAGFTSSVRAYGTAARDAALAEGASVEAANRIAARAITHRIALEGAGYGGTYGFNSSSGGVRDRLVGGVEGAATGALTGLALRPLAGRATPKSDPATAIQDEAAAAAQRQGLDTLPADTGGPVTKGLTAFTAQTPFGAGPIIAAARRINAAGGEKLTGIANDLGSVADDVEGLGTAASEGAVKYAQAAKRAGGRLYDIAADKAGDATVDLKSARDTLDQQIARLKAVPGGGAGLEEAQNLREALNKPYTVQGVRDLRTEMFVPTEFRNTPVEGRTKAFVNAAAQDVENSLREQGKGDAADAFRAADDNWRQMLVNLKRNVEPIIGKLDNLKSPEAVSSALNSAAKNNGGRLASFVNSLPQEQQGIVRGTLLSRLGYDNDGNFSLSRFSTDWNKISPIAKRQMFGNESVAALNDLASVGEGAKAAMKFGNHSNTGRAVITERTLGALGTGATVAAGVKTLGLAVVGQYGLGRLLASPRIARWLARAPRTALSDTAYIDRLDRIAKAEPAIAGDVIKLKDHLTQDATQ